MLDLSNTNSIKYLINKYDFSFKRSLGQNFLINPTVCPRMAEFSIDHDVEGVIEIGPGFGILTKELAIRAKKVLAIEIDPRIPQILNETLSEFDNVTLIEGDVLKLDLISLINKHFQGMKISICANLPYYITSPIIMHLLELELPVESITVMVQKEAAERICANVGSREAGSVTVAINYYSQPQILFNVTRASFMPQPKVDSSVIKLNLLSEPPVKISNKKLFFKLVRTAFSQRRKTFVNSACSAGDPITKDLLIKTLESLDISTDVRVERLSMQQLAAISNYISDHYIY